MKTLSVTTVESRGGAAVVDGEEEEEDEEEESGVGREREVERKRTERRVN